LHGAFIVEIRTLLGFLAALLETCCESHYHLCCSGNFSSQTLQPNSKTRRVRAHDGLNERSDQRCCFTGIEGPKNRRAGSRVDI
jgi:hypothetical protein